MDYILRGLLIGFAIAAPVGPIGVLCIRRTLTQGRLIGFLSGLGAASADLAYGALAAFGLTIVQNLLLTNAVLLRFLGGGFLVYLGVRTLLSKPADQPAEASSESLFQAYLSTFFLTLTNPMTILSFMAIFASFRLGDGQGDLASAALLVLGVFLGSAGWWLTLTSGVGFLRGRLSPALLLWVNRGAGAIILIYGIAAFLVRV